MIISYIALGSNLGERNKNIQQALKYLSQDSNIDILQVSSLIVTKPQNCPPQTDFLNGVVKLQTDYSAQELLRKLQEIETRMGREYPRQKNLPRTIDLDILLYGDAKIDEYNLKIPHPRMWEREFVKKPLKEIAPQLFSQNLDS
jgi:2-amino-4-hydroxy-6-hydroxymethyldihydropteridine diphosphokinase